MSLLMLEAKRETQRHPLHASSPLRLPEKLVREAAVLRYWPWREATQLPHRMLPRSHMCVNFFFWYINLRVCGISVQEDRTLVGDYQLSEGGWRTRGKGGRVGVYSALASGASSRVVRPSGDCSSLWWCLASYNLQNAHPFAEVWWMGGGGGGVEWKGRGMVDYSDTYRKGGSGVSWVNKKKKLSTEVMSLLFLLGLCILKRSSCAFWVPMWSYEVLFLLLLKGLQSEKRPKSTPKGVNLSHTAWIAWFGVESLCASLCNKCYKNIYSHIFIRNCINSSQSADIQLLPSPQEVEQGLKPIFSVAELCNYSVMWCPVAQKYLFLIS